MSWLKSFFKGVASIFDLAPPSDLREIGSGSEDDWRNIGSDFKRVGKDLENSIESHLTDERNSD